MMKREPDFSVVPKGPKFKMTMHLNLGEKGGVAIYRDEELGVQCEIHTQKVNGEWGKGVKTFYIDGDEKEYSDIHSLMAALSERV
jgi:hypothetical protein